MIDIHQNLRRKIGPAIIGREQFGVDQWLGPCADRFGDLKNPPSSP